MHDLDCLIPHVTFEQTSGELGGIVGKGGPRETPNGKDFPVEEND